jgi:hypothetical protein
MTAGRNIGMLDVLGSRPKEILKKLELLLEIDYKHNKEAQKV